MPADPSQFAGLLFLLGVAAAALAVGLIKAGVFTNARAEPGFYDQ